MRSQKILLITKSFGKACQSKLANTTSKSIFPRPFNKVQEHKPYAYKHYAPKLWIYDTFCLPASCQQYKNIWINWSFSDPYNKARAASLQACFPNVRVTYLTSRKQYHKLATYAMLSIPGWCKTRFHDLKRWSSSVQSTKHSYAFEPCTQSSANPYAFSWSTCQQCNNQINSQSPML